MMMPPSKQLDPLPKRLLVFAVLVMLAVAAIRLIDNRAIRRQDEMRRQYENEPLTQPAAIVTGREGVYDMTGVPSAAATSSHR